jgi:hypothetical protein
MTRRKVMRFAIALFFLSFIDCSGCKGEPPPSPQLPSGGGIGEAVGEKNDAGGGETIKAEPVKANIPADAKVSLVVSRDFSPDRVPQPATAIAISLGSRIYIYVFWNGLEINKIYTQSFLVCAPDKAQAEDECWFLKHEFVTADKPVNPNDAVYINPLGWMTKTSFDLALADEMLGIWRIAVWPTGQDSPKAEIYVEVI